MNKTIKYSSLVFLLLLGLTSINQVQGKGKTYDDLDDILKHDGLNSTKTHVAHQEAMESGAHIDPNKVVHRPPPQINEDRAVTSGVVIPKAYTSSNSASRKKSGSQTKTYEQYAKKNDGFDDQSLPLRYLKIPKRDRDAQFYFFLSTLLLLATTITIISSCGCLFYFLLKNLVSMQERMVDDSESPDNQGQNAEVKDKANNNATIIRIFKDLRMKRIRETKNRRSSNKIYQDYLMELEGVDQILWNLNSEIEEYNCIQSIIFSPDTLQFLHLLLQKIEFHFNTIINL